MISEDTMQAAKGVRQLNSYEPLQTIGNAYESLQTSAWQNIHNDTINDIHMLVTTAVSLILEPTQCQGYHA